MIKTKVDFLEGGFYPANQNNLKSFQKALIGWKKLALQKIHFCFDHVNRLYVGNFVQIFVFRPTVDPSVRRGSDGPRRVKNSRSCTRLLLTALLD